MSRPEGTTLVVTYCSRDKNPADGLLPAIDRYVSPRIRSAASAAARQGLEFRILSGLYGLLTPDHPIPDYDHLLTEDRIPEHAELVGGQLGNPGPGRVVFISRSLAEDPGCGPYRDAMAMACTLVGSEFRVREIGPGEPDVDDLSDLN